MAKGRPKLPHEEKRVPIKGFFSVKQKTMDKHGVATIRKAIRETIEKLEVNGN